MADHGRRAGNGWIVRPSTDADLPSIERLLAECGLPLDGAARAFATGVVAIDRATVGDTVVGCAAIEPYDRAALLRSVAVAAGRRGTGIGRLLVDAVEQRALEAGSEVLYLLTESAEMWFERLGYRRIERSDVPAAVAASVEFAVACPETAVAMARPLRSVAPAG